MFDLGYIPPLHWDVKNILKILASEGWRILWPYPSRLLVFGKDGDRILIDATGLGYAILRSGRGKQSLPSGLFIDRRRASYGKNLRTILRGMGKTGTPIRVRSNGKVGTELMRLVESETEAIASNIFMGRYSSQAHRSLVLQKARLTAMSTSPLLKRVDESRWGDLYGLVDAADSDVDASFMESDRGARRAESLLLFLVSVATIIPLFDDGIQWDTLLKNNGFLLSMVLLAGLYVYSWKRK